MSLATWAREYFSRRGRALSLYRRGMAKANKREYESAIADYSAAICIASIPEDVKAMAIYNRALAYSAIDEDKSAAEDLAVVMGMSGLPAKIRTHAQQRYDWVRRRDEMRADRSHRPGKGGG